MGNGPLLSLVIPAHNASEFLEECLQSVADQTFRDYEVIVVDDGSTDDTAAIVRRFADTDSRMRLLQSPRGGVSKARNLGIDQARGKFISFADADDALHPRAFEMMLKAMEETGAAVCITAFHHGARPRFSAPSARREVYSYREAMKIALYQKKLLNAPWGMMMERRLLGDALRFREGSRYEDLDAFYRFYEKADRIAYLPFPFYFYRDNPRSFMNHWSDDRLDALDVTDRMVEFFRNRHPDLEKAALDRRFSAHFNMLLLMRKHGVENHAAKERCLTVIREGRTRALTDRDVRLKNKIGALASWGGAPIINLLSRLS